MGHSLVLLDVFDTFFEDIPHDVALKDKHVMEDIEAERCLTNSLTVRIQKYGDSALWTVEGFVELGWLRAEQGKFSEARGHFQYGLDLAETELSAKHPIALSAVHGLGVLALKERQFKAAEPLLLEAAQGKLDVHGPTYPGTVDAVRDLVELYEARGDPTNVNKWRARLPSNPAE